MKNKMGFTLSGKKSSFMLVVGLLFIAQFSYAQVVGLDNWYNRETNTKTGKPFHYLWTDTENSGYSQWGDLFKKHGASLATIEEAATAANLANVNVYIIVDPDTTTEAKSPNYIMPNDIKAIKNWVKKGGVLVLLANDAPNCEFTHLNQLAAEFGMHFNHVSLHPVINRDWNMGAFTSFPNHPLFKGVSKIYMKEIASIGLKNPAKGILTEKGDVFIAESRLEKGLVIAIGDPWIYNEYIDHTILPADFENLKAAENLTQYLIANTKKAK